MFLYVQFSKLERYFSILSPSSFVAKRYIFLVMISKLRVVNMNK